MVLNVPCRAAARPAGVRFDATVSPGPLASPPPELEDVVMTVARKCEQCGRIDARVSWPSTEDAAKDPVFDSWTCPMCAWTEFDLVELEDQPVNA